ncbi:MAG: NADH-quinone oxidoreductase subunit NuoH [Anaerolineales bacterium]|nr:NADH-quinone oxidoreductase subunit NuoH [Anaerolineales bacterium]
MSFDFGDPFGWFGQWIRSLLEGIGLAPGFVSFLLSLVGAFLLGLVALLSAFGLIWVERKIVARIQDRLGPNRVGPFGLFQTIADGLKLATKELITPVGAYRIPYNLAPLLAVMSVVGIWAVVPLAPRLIGSDLNVGVLYVISIGAVGTLAIILAGMSSNNKYALLGAFRTVAQMVSFAVPMVLALLVPVLLAGSMGMVQITEAQRPVWFVVLAPFAALIFFISSLAEVGRAPFDILEAESEIVAGFHIEYSGLRFGMFFVAEFLHAFTISALTTTLFFGGWQGPGATQFPLLGLLYFFIKTSLVYFVVIWIRGSFPRIRIDQMNNLNWKFFTPLALAGLVFTAVAEKLVSELALNRVLLHIGANGLLLVLTLFALGIYARRKRREMQGLAIRGPEAAVASTAQASAKK